MKKIAVSRGGLCLSDSYITAKTKIRWRCKGGHEWTASPDSVKHGAWCPKCAVKANGIKKRLTIEELKKIAISRGGLCLSETYVNAKTKLHWRCKENHERVSTPLSVKYAGTWCPICAIEVRTNKKVYARAPETAKKPFKHSSQHIH